MAFEGKIDYVGIGTQFGSGFTKVAVKANAQGVTNQVLEEIGADGSILSTSFTYGYVANPTTEYVIKADAVLTAGLKLGKVYNTSQGINRHDLTGTYGYALRSYTYSTGAGQEPTLNADAVQIEITSNTYCTYQTDPLSVSPAKHASAFGIFQQDVESYTDPYKGVLQSGTFVAEADITPATINGSPVASDATQGRETATITIWIASDSNSNKLTSNWTPKANEGWLQTSNWTITGGDSSMYEATATFTKYLSAEHTVLTGG